MATGLYFHVARALSQGVPQPPHQDCPSKGIAGSRMSPTPPSSQDPTSPSAAPNPGNGQAIHFSRAMKTSKSVINKPQPKEKQRQQTMLYLNEV